MEYDGTSVLFSEDDKKSFCIGSVVLLVLFYELFQKLDGMYSRLIL